ncbi:MAG: helix-turn-helix domain-containing protein [Bacteroidia bacterium]
MQNKSDNYILKRIGLSIRKERIKQGITQAQMAFELGTSTKQYQRIEYGEINTGVLNIIKICTILSVSVTEILPKELFKSD